jgi:hypothetical protein
MPEIAFMRHVDATGGPTYPNVASEFALGTAPNDSLFDDESSNEIKIPWAYPDVHRLRHVLTTESVPKRLQNIAFIIDWGNKEALRYYLRINNDILFSQPLFRPLQSESSLGWTFWGANPDKTATVFNWSHFLRRPAPMFRKATIEKFERLATDWRANRNNIGSVLDMCSHIAYQQIIGMGKDAVPLILRELEREIDHWFWALRAITAEDPVTENHRGRLALMARDWLDWAKIQGYQW